MEVGEELTRPVPPAGKAKIPAYEKDASPLSLSRY